MTHPTDYRAAALASARHAAILELLRPPPGPPAYHPPGPPPPPDPAGNAALYRRFGSRPRVPVPDGSGVVAASDAGQFPVLQLMLASLLLSHRAAVAVFDLGLDDRQRRWLARQGVSVLPGAVQDFPRVPAWQAWVKPLLILRSPFRRTLWLDNDVVVDGPLTGVFRAVESGPVLAGDFFNPAAVPNPAALYERFPVPDPSSAPVLCSGVLGFDAARDRPLLDDWAGLVWRAARDDSLRALVSWWDQGALVAAAARRGLTASTERAWNFPGRDLKDFPGPKYGLASALVDALPPPGEAVVVHFQGHPKPHGWPALDVELAAPGDMTVFVLGHHPLRFDSVPPRPFLEPVDLDLSGVDPLYAETRFFLGLTDGDLAALPEYVGCATQRWNTKYPADVLRLEELHRVRGALGRDTVVYASPVGPDWPDLMEAWNPGITGVVAAVRRWGRPEGPRTFWSNNFICHRDVFREFVAHVRRVHALILAEWGTEFPFRALDPRRPGGYVYEAVSVSYWASRTDLRLLSTAEAAALASGEPRKPGG